MARFPNADWNLPKNSDGRIETWDAVKIAVLMDIRDELQKLNLLLHCTNFTDIPGILRKIEVNTRKRTRKPKETK